MAVLWAGFKVGTLNDPLEPAKGPD
jgi:hypothetical protein